MWSNCVRYAIAFIDWSRAIVSELRFTSMPLMFHNNSFALRIPNQFDVRFKSHKFQFFCDRSFDVASWVEGNYRRNVNSSWPESMRDLRAILCSNMFRLNREQRIVTFKLFLTCVIFEWSRKWRAQFIEFSQLLSDYVTAWNSMFVYTHTRCFLPTYPISKSLWLAHDVAISKQITTSETFSLCCFCTISHLTPSSSSVERKSFSFRTRW